MASSVAIGLIMGAAVVLLTVYRDRVVGHGPFLTRGVVYAFIAVSGIVVLLEALAIGLHVAA